MDMGHVFCKFEENEGVCHTMALPFTLKSISSPKKRIMKTQIFHHAKILSSKNPFKKTKKPSRYHSSITNLKFQHKPRYHLSKILI
jgi:hypothetical protein